MTKPIKKLFLSYSRKNTDAAFKLKGELEAAGFDVWMDQSSIELGKLWNDAIESAINDTDCVLALQSTIALASENIEDELLYAKDQGKRIIPVLLEECHLPLIIRRFQYIALYPRYHEQLKILVAALTGEEVPPPPPPPPFRKKHLILISIASVLAVAGISFYFLQKNTAHIGTKNPGLKVVVYVRSEYFRYKVSDYFQNLNTLPADLLQYPNPRDFLAKFDSVHADAARSPGIFTTAETGDTLRITIHPDKVPQANGVVAAFDTAFFNSSPFVDLNGKLWFDLGETAAGKHEVLYKQDLDNHPVQLLFITTRHD